MDLDAGFARRSLRIIPHLMICGHQSDFTDATHRREVAPSSAPVRPSAPRNLIEPFS
jgi:hypothetical protein